MAKKTLRDVLLNLNTYDEILCIKLSNRNFNLDSICSISIEEAFGSSNLVIGLTIIKDILDNLRREHDGYDEQDALKAIRNYLLRDN